MNSNSNKADKGKGKFASLNINNVYKGRSTEQQQKPAHRHYGMQVVGKVQGMRRMPPPAWFPSIKAETGGNDPRVNLVPSGSSGWGGSNGSSGPNTNQEAAASASVPGKSQTPVSEQQQSSQSHSSWSGVTGANIQQGSQNEGSIYPKKHTPFYGHSAQDFPKLSVEGGGSGGGFGGESDGSGHNTVGGGAMSLRPQTTPSNWRERRVHQADSGGGSGGGSLSVEHTGGDDFDSISGGGGHDNFSRASDNRVPFSQSSNRDRFRSSPATELSHQPVGNPTDKQTKGDIAATGWAAVEDEPNFDEKIVFSDEEDDIDVMPSKSESNDRSDHHHYQQPSQHRDRDREAGHDTHHSSAGSGSSNLNPRADSSSLSTDEKGGSTVERMGAPSPGMARPREAWGGSNAGPFVPPYGPPFSFDYRSHPTPPNMPPFYPGAVHRMNMPPGPPGAQLQHPQQVERESENASAHGTQQRWMGEQRNARNQEYRNAIERAQRKKQEEERNLTARMREGSEAKLRELDERTASRRRQESSASEAENISTSAAPSASSLIEEGGSAPGGPPTLPPTTAAAVLPPHPQAPPHIGHMPPPINYQCMPPGQPHPRFPMPWPSGYPQGHMHPQHPHGHVMPQNIYPHPIFQPVVGEKLMEKWFEFLSTHNTDSEAARKPEAKEETTDNNSDKKRVVEQPDPFAEDETSKDDSENAIKGGKKSKTVEVKVNETADTHSVRPASTSSSTDQQHTRILKRDPNSPPIRQMPQQQQKGGLGIRQGSQQLPDDDRSSESSGRAVAPIITPTSVPSDAINRPVQQKDSRPDRHNAGGSSRRDDRRDDRSRGSQSQKSHPQHQQNFPQQPQTKPKPLMENPVQPPASVTQRKNDHDRLDIEEGREFYNRQYLPSKNQQRRDDPRHYGPPLDDYFYGSEQGPSAAIGASRSNKRSSHNADYTFFQKQQWQRQQRQQLQSSHYNEEEELEEEDGSGVGYGAGSRYYGSTGGQRNRGTRGASYTIGSGRSRGGRSFTRGAPLYPRGRNHDGSSSRSRGNREVGGNEGRRNINSRGNHAGGEREEIEVAGDATQQQASQPQASANRGNNKDQAKQVAGRTGGGKVTTEEGGASQQTSGKDRVRRNNPKNDRSNAGRSGKKESQNTSLDSISKEALASGNTEVSGDLATSGEVRKTEEKEEKIVRSSSEITAAPLPVTNVWTTVHPLIEKTASANLSASQESATGNSTPSASRSRQGTPSGEQTGKTSVVDDNNGDEATTGTGASYTGTNVGSSKDNKGSRSQRGGGGGTRNVRRGNRRGGGNDAGGSGSYGDREGGDWGSGRQDSGAGRCSNYPQSRRYDNKNYDSQADGWSGGGGYRGNNRERTGGGGRGARGGSMAGGRGGRSHAGAAYDGRHGHAGDHRSGPEKGGQGTGGRSDGKSGRDKRQSSMPKEIVSDGNELEQDEWETASEGSNVSQQHQHSRRGGNNGSDTGGCSNRRGGGGGGGPTSGGGASGSGPSNGTGGAPSSSTAGSNSGNVNGGGGQNSGNSGGGDKVSNSSSQHHRRVHQLVAGTNNNNSSGGFRRQNESWSSTGASSGRGSVSNSDSSSVDRRRQLPSHIELNNIANVVDIANLPDVTEDEELLYETTEQFQEVLSKTTRKHRKLEEQRRQMQQLIPHREPGSGAGGKGGQRGKNSDGQSKSGKSGSGRAGKASTRKSISDRHSNSRTLPPRLAKQKSGGGSQQQEDSRSSGETNNGSRKTSGDDVAASGDSKKASTDPLLSLPTLSTSEAWQKDADIITEEVSKTKIPLHMSAAPSAVSSSISVLTDKSKPEGSLVIDSWDSRLVEKATSKKSEAHGMGRKDGNALPKPIGTPAALMSVNHRLSSAEKDTGSRDSGVDTAEGGSSNRSSPKSQSLKTDCSTDAMGKVIRQVPISKKSGQQRPTVAEMPSDCDNPSHSALTVMNSYSEKPEDEIELSFYPLDENDMAEGKGVSVTKDTDVCRGLAEDNTSQEKLDSKINSVKNLWYASDGSSGVTCVEGVSVSTSVAAALSGSYQTSMEPLNSSGSNVGGIPVSNQTNICKVRPQLQQQQQMQQRSQSSSVPPDPTGTPSSDRHQSVTPTSSICLNASSAQSQQQQTASHRPQQPISSPYNVPSQASGPMFCQDSMSAATVGGTFHMDTAQQHHAAHQQGQQWSSMNLVPQQQQAHHSRHLNLGGNKPILSQAGQQPGSFNSLLYPKYTMNLQPTSGLQQGPSAGHLAHAAASCQFVAATGTRSLSTEAPNSNVAALSTHQLFALFQQQPPYGAQQSSILSHSDPMGGQPQSVQSASGVQPSVPSGTPGNYSTTIGGGFNLNSIGSLMTAQAAPGAPGFNPKTQGNSGGGGGSASGSGSQQMAPVGGYSQQQARQQARPPPNFPGQLPAGFPNAAASFGNPGSHQTIGAPPSAGQYSFCQTLPGAKLNASGLGGAGSHAHLQNRGMDSVGEPSHFNYHHSNSVQLPSGFPSDINSTIFPTPSSAAASYAGHNMPPPPDGFMGYKTAGPLPQNPSHHPLSSHSALLHSASSHHYQQQPQQSHHHSMPLLQPGGSSGDVGSMILPHHHDHSSLQQHMAPLAGQPAALRDIQRESQQHQQSHRPQKQPQPNSQQQQYRDNSMQQAQFSSMSSLLSQQRGGNSSQRLTQGPPQSQQPQPQPSLRPSASSRGAKQPGLSQGGRKNSAPVVSLGSGGIGVGVGVVNHGYENTQLTTQTAESFASFNQKDLQRVVMQMRKGPLPLASRPSSGPGSMNRSSGGMRSPYSGGGVDYNNTFSSSLSTGKRGGRGGFSTASKRGGLQHSKLLTQQEHQSVSTGDLTSRENGEETPSNNPTNILALNQSSSSAIDATIECEPQESSSLDAADALSSLPSAMIVNVVDS